MNINHSPAPWKIDRNNLYDATGQLLFTAWIPGGNARVYLAVNEMETNLALARHIPAMLAALLAEGEVDHLLEEGDDIPLELTSRARRLRQEALSAIHAALEEISKGGSPTT